MVFDNNSAVFLQLNLPYHHCHQTCWETPQGLKHHVPLRYFLVEIAGRVVVLARMHDICDHFHLSVCNQTTDYQHAVVDFCVFLTRLALFHLLAQTRLGAMSSPFLSAVLVVLEGATMGVSQNKGCCVGSHVSGGPYISSTSQPLIVLTTHTLKQVVHPFTRLIMLSPAPTLQTPLKRYSACVCATT